MTKRGGSRAVSPLTGNPGNFLPTPFPKKIQSVSMSPGCIGPFLSTAPSPTGKQAGGDVRGSSSSRGLLPPPLSDGGMGLKLKMNSALITRVLRHFRGTDVCNLL